jgi:hypothetical protein
MPDPPQVSDECREAVAELAFRFLRAMDDGDLAFLTEAILRIAEWEARRAAAEAWDLCCAVTKDAAALTATRSRQETFGLLLGQLARGN